MSKWSIQYSLRKICLYPQECMYNVTLANKWNNVCPSNENLNEIIYRSGRPGTPSSPDTRPSSPEDGMNKSKKRYRKKRRSWRKRKNSKRIRLSRPNRNNSERIRFPSNLMWPDLHQCNIFNVVLTVSSSNVAYIRSTNSPPDLV